MAGKRNRIHGALLWVGRGITAPPGWEFNGLAPTIEGTTEGLSKTVAPQVFGGAHKGGFMTISGLDPQRWLDEHGDTLYRYARLRVGEAAEDIVQETLLAAWQGRARYTGQAAERGWLMGILKHKVVDHLRRHYRQRDVEIDAGEDGIDGWFDASGHWATPPGDWGGKLAESTQFWSWLERCMERLPPRQKLVFALRDLEGEEAEVVCKEIEVNANHLYVLLHRARLSLRRCLEGQGIGATFPEEGLK